MNTQQDDMQEINESFSKQFKVYCSKPLNITYKVMLPGLIKLKLDRSGVFLAHMEGVICHSRGPETLFSLPYRSDKEGFKKNFEV